MDRIEFLLHVRKYLDNELYDRIQCNEMFANRQFYNEIKTNPEMRANPVYDCIRRIVNKTNTYNTFIFIMDVGIRCCLLIFCAIVLLGLPTSSLAYEVPVPETVTTVFTSLANWVNYTISPVTCTVTNGFAPEGIVATFTLEEYKSNGVILYYSVMMYYVTNTSFRAYPLGEAVVDPTNSFPILIDIQSFFWTLVRYYCTIQTISYGSVKFPPWNELNVYYWYYPVRFESASCPAPCSTTDTMGIYSTGSGVSESYWIIYNSTQFQNSYPLAYYAVMPNIRNQDYYMLKLFQQIYTALIDSRHVVWCFLSDPSLCN